jgi:hypothetical protein
LIFHPVCTFASSLSTTIKPEAGSFPHSYPKRHKAAKLSPKTSPENTSPSPDRSGNPFWDGVRAKKIEAHSGNKLLKSMSILKIPKTD